MPLIGARGAEVSIGGVLPDFEGLSLEGRPVSLEARPTTRPWSSAIADRTPGAFLVDASGRLRYRGWVKPKQESPDLKRGCAVDRY